MSEASDAVCPNCGATLRPVTTDGWIDIFRTRNADGLAVRFYGIFSKFDGLSGIFGWVEYPEQVPEGLFCERGHIGLSKKGRIVQ